MAAEPRVKNKAVSGNEAACVFPSLFVRSFATIFRFGGVAVLVAFYCFIRYVFYILSNIQAMHSISIMLHGNIWSISVNWRKCNDSFSPISNK